MKTIKYIVLGVLLCSTCVMTSCTEMYEEHQTQSTGDNADDLVKPGGNSKGTVYEVYGTGDNADDPVKPGGN